jgi:ribosomal protein RSM22 (predicted rRNA methylase)
MQLPAALRRAVEQELSSSNASALRSASSLLSQRYRAGDVASGAMTSGDARNAYLAVRLPATFAAVASALRWTGECFAEELHSVLDLGTGPGTALWAAAEVLPEVQSLAGLERDPQLLSLAARLARTAESSTLRAAQWLPGDLTAALPTGKWDLVICSYALNELREAQRAEFIRRAWDRTEKLLVLIEPGTKPGFANVLAARSLLLKHGATIAAPCPHALACPMASDDWCHFAARVERTADHRRLKDASLGHEDEKFSYIAFARGSASSPQARIVRHPRIFSGYTQLSLCKADGIVNTTVTRSMKEDWRRLKRLGWGDAW